MSNKRKSQALLEFLQEAHADQYQGLDDEMPDNCNEWIGSLTDDEICNLVLAVYHEGI